MVQRKHQWLSKANKVNAGAADAIIWSVIIQNAVASYALNVQDLRPLAFAVGSCAAAFTPHPSTVQIPGDAVYMYAAAGSIDPWGKNLAPRARAFARSLGVPSNRTGAGTDAHLPILSAAGLALAT